MSKRHDKHQHRLQELSLFGKDLVRRSASHCELCHVHGQPLKIYELPPVPTEPDFAHCIMICETCFDQIEHPKRIDINHWHCLAQSIWSEVQPVRVISVVLLRHLALSHDWAQVQLEELYIDPEDQLWIDQITL